NTTQSTTSTASSEDSSAAASLKQNVTKQSENPVQQSTSS
ncbi:unnamed protein product, partial [Rotaria magnacalcarata]